MGYYQVRVYSLAETDVVRAYTIYGAEAKARMIYGEDEDTIVEVKEIEDEGRISEYNRDAKT